MCRGSISRVRSDERLVEPSESSKWFFVILQENGREKQLLLSNVAQIPDFVNSGMDLSYPLGANRLRQVQ